MIARNEPKLSHQVRTNRRGTVGRIASIRTMKEIPQPTVYRSFLCIKLHSCRSITIYLIKKCPSSERLQCDGNGHFLYLRIDLLNKVVSKIRGCCYSAELLLGITVGKPKNNGVSFMVEAKIVLQRQEIFLSPQYH